MTWDRLTGPMTVQLWEQINRVNHLSNQTTEPIIWATGKQRHSNEIQQNEQGLKWVVEGWFRRGGGGVRGGCACAPSYSVDSCLQWSNGVWWVEVLSYHVFLSSSGMYCLTISSAWLSTFCRLGDRDGLVRIGRGGVAVSLWVVFFSSSINTTYAVSPEPVPDTFRWL